MTEDRKPKFFYGYIVVLLASLIMAMTWGSIYSFGIFFKPMLTEFGWTRAATSGAYSLVILLQGFIGIFTGRLSDRFGPRKVVTACGLLLVLGYVLMSQISAIWQLYLFYGVLVGIGSSGAYIPSISAVSRWFIKRRGLMTGIAVSGIGVGIMIMSPIASWLISNYGWRPSFIVIGIMAFVLVVLSAQFLKRDPSEVEQLPYGEGEVGQESLISGDGGFSFQRAIHTRQFWVVGIMFLCFGFCQQTIMVHIVPHATDLAISPVSAASILTIIGGVSVAGKVIWGSAGDRIGNKQALIVCFIMMFVALTWFLVAKELWMFYLFAVIFGFAYGGWAALISLMVAELFGLASLGLILGAIIFEVAIGNASGPILAGWIFDITGSYQSAFLVCAALCIIAIIFAVLLRPITNASIKRGH